MVWNYHDDDLPAAAAPVTITVENLPAERVLLHHYRIDQEHSNACAAWQRMGSPQAPTPDQYAELERAGELQLLHSPVWINVDGHAAEISVALPRQAVSLLKLSW